ncbi:succinate dehydrogenase assembly factor 1, mitochondrial-like [Hibiscus syriacus]|uniref:succinate dehydrogenase assembly factor 1, mitochondrial-like n=1 Tax=Hibiscus syriacus TaxID=106335 RepID=UPI001921D5C1|nr:succinate dehydrogenase assembly factor 1, mitochondrial-like [Hibiscus syriacus]
MGASKGQKLSGMQRQVLSLYRGFLRAVRSKPAEDRRQIESIVLADFRRNSNQVDLKKFLYIEYLLRRGKKQLDQLKSPDTVGLSSVDVGSSKTKCRYLNTIIDT